MKTVYIYDKSCCRTNVIEDLASYIRQELAQEVEVKVFDLAKPNQSVPVPRSLFLKMQSDGGKSLPAIVVDNVIIALGKLPEPAVAVDAIKTGKPVGNPQDCSCSSACC
ncbi:arsenic metallochaperone ArsD family protein [Merismopedia glauca]|uniref:Arsenical resistance operon transcriptional repressor ArsD n=1 Tax=Merismopedia glauca CCAP 1448/3 TaxID=1296344 RepID=A0A2T1C6K9_9CYAN|nr:arsenic metallochaperone ArsD family protein [Merismopedia glauca]PSB03876.1 hypothetical protein C7B64_06640 [Merismopedia glauca CCAP 1448/3]